MRPHKCGLWRPRFARCASRKRASRASVLTGERPRCARPALPAQRAASEPPVRQAHCSPCCREARSWGDQAHLHRHSRTSCADQCSCPNKRARHLLLHTPLFRATAARRTLELCWAGLHTATLRGVHITLHLLLGDRSGLGRDAVGVVTTKNSP